jgi:superfamily II DNA or RNA helicase
MREKIQKEALDRIINHKFKGILMVAPRVGKTKILIDAVNQFEGTVTVISKYNTILEGWQGELEKWNCNKDITFVNQMSLTKEHKSDLLICDECHTLSDAQIENIQSIGFKNVLGATGTISKETFFKIRPIFKRVIYEYPIEQAIKDKIISNYKITVITLPLDSKDKYVPSGTIAKPFLSTEAQAYSYFTSQFNRFKILSHKDKKFENTKFLYAGKRSRFIYGAKSKLDLVKRFLSKVKDKTLIFTVLTDIANELAPHSYHSKTRTDEDNLQAFINDEFDRLAVCNMVSMGITIPNLKVGIFHQLQSAPEAAQQKIMRMCNYVAPNVVADIYIFAYEGTVDIDWVNKALEPFDQKKIKYDSHRNY